MARAVLWRRSMKPSIPRRGVLALITFLVFTVACLSRPITTENPTTNRVIRVPMTQAGIDKIDLLFAIDSSASMGDKQELFAQAVPALLHRLIEPDCISTNLSCTQTGDCASLGTGGQCDTSRGVCFVPSSAAACPAGTKIEFPPVHDIHIGIVSSSLGGGGSPDVCVEQASDPTHQNDKGHLLNRTKGTPEGSIANAKPLNGTGGDFLAWLPASNPLNAGKPDPNVTKYGDGEQTALVTDFQSLVTGVQEHGCGLEAQLESWYRFLVQPDPYDSIAMTSDNPPKASLQGVDATLLKMRQDFLRPDSLVMIVQITDEEDSWSDPSWLGGYGWTVRTNDFPGGPGVAAGPRGTSECDQPIDPKNVASTGPNNPDCASCAFPSSVKPVKGTPIGQDPNCNACAGGMATCPQKGWYTPASLSTPPLAADGLNVRYTNAMRGRYGLDPQWNVQRYVDGLHSRVVPDRAHEVHDATQYASTQKNCQNPLFAASLPDGSDVTPGALCNLQDGPRDSSLVYYLIIGGVPWQLLAQDPLNPSLPLKRTLDTADWRRIVGTDPAHYVYDGIDPHMIESVVPRAGLEAPGSSYSTGGDVINGREWNTLTSNAAIDLQYACVFDLAQPKDCTSPANANACDCTGSAASAPDGPPLCDPNVRTTQIRGKAYPTIRELRVAEGLENQGVVASICPKNQTSYFEVLFTRIRTSIKQ